MITRRRVARKRHRCDACQDYRLQPEYGGRIKPGDTYLEYMSFPRDPVLDLSNDTFARYRECTDCAAKRTGTCQ